MASATAEDYNFDNIYNDFLSTTGYNVNNALETSGYRDLGWVKDFKYTNNPDSLREVDPNRYSFQHQKWSGSSGPQTSSGMLGESTGPVFSQDLYDGLAAQAAGAGAKRFLAERQAENMTDYEDWAREGSSYQAQVDSMLQSASLQDEAFMAMQSDLDNARAGLGGPSRASSMGAYSQAAKRQMQATQRTIAELSGASAPRAMTANLTFKDPVTGETRAFTDTFDEEGAYNSMSTLDDARSFVNDRFTTRSSEIFEDLYGGLAESRGYSFDDLTNTDSDFMTSFREAEALYGELPRASKGYVQIGDTGFTKSSFESARSAIGTLDEVQKFSEYRTLAEMSGATEGFAADTFQGENTAVSGTLALMRAQDFDINESLENMARDTQARFEINDLQDIDRTRAEFDRRKSLAEATALDVDRRNEINKTRERSLIEERRKYEQSLEQQKQEYASTLASYGASENSDGAITFNSIRPQ